MLYDEAAEAADLIRSKYASPLRVGIVLGSGLGAFADQLENVTAIPYEEIPNFARSTVVGHRGRLVLGELDGVSVAAMQGRFHFYEGYSMDQVVLPIRTLGLLGVKVLFLTNAAGSLSTEMRPGTLMLITDHLNCTGQNPLRGPNDDRFGPRFPDMTSVYDHEIQEIIVECANEIQGERKEPVDFLHRGVYCGLSGPTYETPAEIRMYRLLGADAVGMSTVPEAIVARHQGMRVAGISCITNLAAGMTDDEIDHSHVMETSGVAAEVFAELVKRAIKRICS